MYKYHQRAERNEPHRSKNDALRKLSTFYWVPLYTYNQPYGRCLMGLLQDQSVMAGMGNYLCCEALHAAGIHPQHRPADLNATQLRRLTGTCLRLIRQSYETGGITNDLERATILRKQGASFEASRFHVYRRAGLPCYRCGTDIIKGTFCGRMGYLCPTCQGRSGTGGDIQRE